MSCSSIEVSLRNINRIPESGRIGFGERNNRNRLAQVLFSCPKLRFLLFNVPTYNQVWLSMTNTIEYLIHPDFFFFRLFEHQTNLQHKVGKKDDNLK
jgi:hypothetical protein